jgi:hypothetical protein
VEGDFNVDGPSVQSREAPSSGIGALARPEGVLYDQVVETLPPKYVVDVCRERPEPTLLIVPQNKLHENFTGEKSNRGLTRHAKLASGPGNPVARRARDI